MKINVCAKYDASLPEYNISAPGILLRNLRRLQKMCPVIWNLRIPK